MGDIEKLETLVRELAEENVKLSSNLRNTTDTLRMEIDRVAMMVQGGGPLQPQPIVQPEAAAVRAKNVADLKLAVRMSDKVKDFKEGQELKVQEWIRIFDDEITQLKNWNGIVNDLELTTYVDCFKDKLDVNVVKRLDAAFKNQAPVITWANVTVGQLHDIMVREFGTKEPDVRAILLQFGPKRLKKAPDMSVATFYCKWQERLPTCMLPTDANKNDKFLDLVKRASFYVGLNDKYIQEHLYQLEGDDWTLETYYEEACLAEQKRDLEMGASASQVEASASITGNEGDTRNNNYGRSGHSDKPSLKNIYCSVKSDNSGKGRVESVAKYRR